LNNNYKILKKTKKKMDSLTFCYEKTLPCDKINNSPLGRKLEVSKHNIITVLPTIAKANEYASTDGWKAPRWNRAKETRCEYIARVGMRFSEGDYTSP